MAYYRASFSFGTTGSKTLTLPLGGVTPVGLRVTGGPRLNTTESSALLAQGGTDGTRTHCFTTAPGFTKRWPYTGEPNYLLSLHSSAATKVLSFTFTSWTTDQATINVDVANANYPVVIEAWG